MVFGEKFILVKSNLMFSTTSPLWNVENISRERENRMGKMSQISQYIKLCVTLALKFDILNVMTYFGDLLSFVEHYSSSGECGNYPKREKLSLSSLSNDL